MKTRRAIFFTLSCFLLSIALLSGCSTSKSHTPSTANNTKPEVKQEVTLYFGDNQAEYVVPEKRTVQMKAGDQESQAAAIVRALIAGPDNKNLQATIPPETRLLSVKIKSGVAQVDFSQEIISKHWGGSAGETMTINSLVNSLTELKGIKSVQILVKGQIQDSLLGHWDTSKPISRNEDIIRR